MGRSPCCEKVGLKKGTWTPEEDQKLLSYIERHGHGSWHGLPTKAGLQRCGKSCRLRWTNYLRPDIKRGKFSLQEEQSIIQLHALLGNRWSAIAAHLPKRTDNEIKNYWNTHLKKKLIKMGIDPTTHKPKTNALSSGQQKDTANLNHMAQWESARLEAESRVVRESKLISTAPYHPHLGYFASAQLPLSKATVSTIVPPPLQPTVPPCLDILKAWQGTWTTKPNDIFASNGSLQSPTSTLHLPDNIFTMCATPLFGENLLFSTLLDFESGIAKENGQVNQDQLKVETRMEGSMDNTMQFNDIEYRTDAAYIEDPLRPPIFVDSNNTTGPLIHNLDSSLGGGLEDNRKYWNNNVLNEDTRALGSPIS